MAHLLEFETALKEVVNAKRLSASKMNNLTEIALKSMADDTQLVSILFRTHKSLQSAAKISSLYVFDALARAARTQVSKHGLTGDINTHPGNCATFLLKLEGILDGLFQNMASVPLPEAKEKSKKVLDIWVKGSTFPASVLARLKEVVSNEPGKDNGVKVPTDPRLHAAAPPPTVIPSYAVPPAAPSADPQATLLALLTQAAANNAAAQAPPIPIPPLQPNYQQAALLQQLSLVASLGNVSQPPVPAAIPAYPSVSPPPYAPNGGDRRDPRVDGNDYRRNDERASFRRGPPGRYDSRDRDRDSRDYGHKDDRRGGRRDSRSRSPPSRFPGRREVRPYSPPRRPSLPEPAPPQPVGRAPARTAPGKDEFGRDIRPASPSPEPPDDLVAPPPKSPPAPVVSPRVEREPADAPAASNHDHQMSLPSSVDATSLVSNKIPSKQGLESFNLATFDFTAATSWETLGNLWQVTHGYPPSTEELMAFVMSGGQMQPSQQLSHQKQQQQQVSQQQQWGRQGQPSSRGGFRGRGGNFRGSGRGNHGGGNHYGGGYREDGGSQWQSSGSGDTDAVVLGGGQDISSIPDAGASGGRMQKVGEKWLFVREE
ncbi:unnamed protein product [Mycena citricolor]|uniref:CID domain-containing protein n=1 Tax=Mycena citricolor TaxID=2018698 RepID=A0AAD2K7H1_9AGAR|nr:unnamed protein product [Mycena citricolor]